MRLDLSGSTKSVADLAPGDFFVFFDRHEPAFGFSVRLNDDEWLALFTPLKGCRLVTRDAVGRTRVVFVFADTVFVPSTRRDDCMDIRSLYPVGSVGIIDREVLLTVDEAVVLDVGSGQLKHYSHTPGAVWFKRWSIVATQLGKPAAILTFEANDVKDS